MTEAADWNLGFEEGGQVFQSASQNARVWTERWIGTWCFCPNCGAQKMESFANNNPVGDFHCGTCAEEYELKSQKGRFGVRVTDGAYETMTRRLASNNNPNLMLLSYDLDRRAVTNLMVVPKHFFTSAIIEKRKPLGPQARRAGWTGCNIRIGDVPDAGKIFIVRDGAISPRQTVQDQWRSTLFLREERLATRGWLLEVMKCVEAVGRPEFTLDDIYVQEARLAALYPGNNNVRPKIRQQLQVLRDRGFLEFARRGTYRLATAA